MAFLGEIEQGLCIMSLTFGEYHSCLRIEVKEVNICGKLFILSLIYSYVAACRFCVVLRLIIIYSYVAACRFCVVLRLIIIYSYVAACRFCAVLRLIIIYSYVAACRFCAVLRLIIICFFLLLSNHSAYVF
jgi:hypothetical protein